MATHSSIQVFLGVSALLLYILGTSSTETVNKQFSVAYAT